MPRWEVGPLVPPPSFTWRRWTQMLGPGMVLGAAAIGGGEWLTGPMVTARYGGALLWLAMCSILGQAIYNIEISRYTLYTGEPIFTGKFRTLPGPRFWLWVYLVLDCGSILPYLASNAAVPLAMVLFGRMPDPVHVPGDGTMLKALACAIFVLCLVPLAFGGKVYNSLKAVMTFKLVVVVGFLLFLAVFFSQGSTWWDIGTGFFKFGTLPVQSVEAAGALGNAATAGVPQGSEIDNVFVAWWQGRSMPPIDFSMFGILAAMAAISGNGGLTNTAVSNYTRDQGWGMGYHVGAIPSVVGGQSIKLSHVGMVFRVDEQSLARWRGWCRHVTREQFAVWVPACVVGIALPSMLSVQFLPRGTNLAEKWLAAGMTADGVAAAVEPAWSGLFWFLTLFCGFLVLATSMVSTGDGVLRRWVDVFWTASPRLRRWDTSDIRKLFFGVLCVFGVFGLAMLLTVKGDRLLVLSTNIYNYALGFSCFHVLVVNHTLLPRPLRPSWFRSVCLALAGAFFAIVAAITTLEALGWLGA